MFTIPCGLCGVAMTDPYLHTAWHVEKGDDVSKAAITRMNELAREAEALTKGTNI